MDGINAVVAELREIRAELKHLNQRFDAALKHRDEVYELRFSSCEEKVENLSHRLERQSLSLEKVRAKVLTWSGAFAVLGVVASFILRKLI